MPLKFKSHPDGLVQKLFRSIPQCRVDTVDFYLSIDMG